MFNDDFDKFTALIDGAIETNPQWKPMSAMGKAIFFKSLEPYSFAQVEAATMAHLRDPKAGMFQPTPAHLIAHILGNAAHDGRPGAEEAWALALAARDESETIVWTSEMQQAWSIALPVLENGDDVGARMAFKEAYLRLVSDARTANRPAKWQTSLGWDMAKRESTIKKAASAGLLPAPAVAALLPAPAPAASEFSAEGLAKVKQLLANLKSPLERAQQQREEQARLDREATEAAKAKIALQTRTYGLDKDAA